MMRIDRKKAQALVASALLAALALYGMYAGAAGRNITAVHEDRDPRLTHQPSAASAAARPRVIRITASRFRFSPNRITLTQGQPVTLELTSADRAHGFLLRALKIDANLEPGKATKLTVAPPAAGTFTAICDHYCGLGHGGMKLTVVVQAAAAAGAVAQIASVSGR